MLCCTSLLKYDYIMFVLICATWTCCFVSLLVGTGTKMLRTLSCLGHLWDLVPCPVCSWFVRNTWELSCVIHKFHSFLQKYENSVSIGDGILTINWEVIFNYHFILKQFYWIFITPIGEIKRQPFFSFRKGSKYKYSLDKIDDWTLLEWNLYLPLYF